MPDDDQYDNDRDDDEEPDYFDDNDPYSDDEK